MPWPGSPLVAAVAAALNGGGNTPTRDTTGADTIVAAVSRLTSENPVFGDAGSFGNDYLLLDSQPDVAGGGLVTHDLYISDGPIVVGPGHFWSLNLGTFAAVVAGAFAGGALIGIDDGGNSNGGGGSSSVQSGAHTPSEPGTLLVSGVVASDGVDPSTIDSGFVIADRVASTGSNFAAGLGYFVQGSPASVNVLWTFTGGATYAAASIRSLKAAAAVGGGLVIDRPHGSIRPFPFLPAGERSRRT
jgi:hypothetical protein